MKTTIFIKHKEIAAFKLAFRLVEQMYDASYVAQERRHGVNAGTYEIEVKYEEPQFLFRLGIAFGKFNYR